MISLTVAICTHNRERYLKQALDSLTHQTVNPDVFEVLVVDNGSTDATSHLLNETRLKMTNLRSIFEPALGLSNARNMALTHARGKYIAFLDDDAVASHHWVESLLGVFDAGGEAVACVGGPIIPIWEVPRPAWLPDPLLCYLSVLDLGAESRQLDPHVEQVFGAGIAFRTDALRRIGGFCIDLGRRGSKLLSCEEWDVQCVLAQMGMHVRYEPAACVFHHVPAERLGLRWFFRRAFWQGASEAVMRRRRERLTLPVRLMRASKSAVQGVLLSWLILVYALGVNRSARVVCMCVTRFLRFGQTFGYVSRID